MTFKFKLNKYILSDKNPKLCFIPAGYAHGYKTLLSNTKIIFFSTSTLIDSSKDDYRYEANYWNPWDVIER